MFQIGLLKALQSSMIKRMPFETLLILLVSRYLNCNTNIYGGHRKILLQTLQLNTDLTIQPISNPQSFFKKTSLLWDFPKFLYWHVMKDLENKKNDGKTFSVAVGNKQTKTRYVCNFFLLVPFEQFKEKFFCKRIFWGNNFWSIRGTLLGLWTKTIFKK